MKCPRRKRYNGITPGSVAKGARDLYSSFLMVLKSSVGDIMNPWNSEPSTAENV